MKHLILGELARFRNLALVFALLHLAVLRISMAVYPLFAQDAAKTSLGILAYSLLGLIFGIHQMGSYRKPNLWAWLINRPLPTSKIYFALAAAAALLAAGVVMVPALLITLYADFFTQTFIDSRHYTMPFFLFGLVMAFYGVGSLVASRTSKLAILVGVLPIFFLTREAVGQWVFLPMVIVLAWLGYLAYSAFDPELDAPLKKPLAVVAAALPMGYALLFVLSVGIVFARSTAIILYEHGPTGFSTFAWNDYWDEGYVPHVGYLPADEALAHGLRLGDTDRSRELLAQIDLADVYEVPGPRFARFPQRHQPFFVDIRHELVDRENEIWWSFSHDRMLFLGQELRTGKPVGSFGVQGAIAAEGDTGAAIETPADQRFDSVPYVIDGRFLVTARQIHEVDLENRSLDLRFEVPEGEMITTTFRQHRSFVVAKSNLRMFFFEPRDLELGTGMLEPLLELELPGEERNISRILIAEMIDSYLVSFVVGSQSFRAYHDSYQRTVELPIGGGEAVVVADVPLAAGFPDWYRHRNFLLSPVLTTSHDLVWTAIGPHREERVSWNDLVSRPLPAPILVQALLLALLAAGGAFWLAGRRHLDSGRRRFWAALTFVLGIPGFVAFVFLARRDESAEAERVESSSRAMAIGLPHPQEGWARREGWSA